jgi:hypothetical protein
MTPKKEVILFTNEDAVNYEMTELNKVINEVKAVKEYLISSEVLVSDLTIEQACNKSFDAIIEDFKSKEVEKLSAFEKQFGTMAAITGNSEARLNEEAEKLRAKLLSGLPPIHYQSYHYWEYIDFDTMEVKQGIDKKFFIDKHSIKVDAETAKHHQNAVEALKFFLDKFPDYNTEVVLGLMLKRNYFERTVELNLDAYDYNKQIRNFVYNRINEIDYTNHKF